MTKLGKNIKKLLEKGYTKYRISKMLKCAFGTVTYYSNPEGRQKALDAKEKYRKNNAWLYTLYNKIGRFKKEKCGPGKRKSPKNIKKSIYDKARHFLVGNGKTMNKYKKLPVDTLLRKVFRNSICYLTGRKIDFTKPETYQLDHIIPKCQGGNNNIENMGVLCTDANVAKHGKTPEQFIALCKEILEYQGYEIKKKKK